MIEAIEYLADMSNSFRVIIFELELNHSFDLTICFFVSKNIGCISIFAMQLIADTVTCVITYNN